MGDKFERVSGFYMSQKLVIQSKTCDFKLKVKGKAIATSNIDLATQIGNLNEPITVSFGKIGIELKARFVIVPACRVKHAHLFEKDKAHFEEEKEDVSTKANSRNESEASISSQMYEDQILFLKNENENLKEDKREIEELRGQVEDIPSLKAQIVQLERTALNGIEGDINSPFQTFSKVKLSN